MQPIRMERWGGSWSMIYLVLIAMSLVVTVLVRNFGGQLLAN